MLQKIIKKAKALGFTDIEIVCTSSDEVNLSLFNGKIDKNFIGSEVNYVVKGLVGTKMAMTSFQKNNEDYTDAEIDALLLKLKDNLMALSTKEEFSIFEGSESYPVIEKVESDIASTPIEAKINLLKELEKKAFAYDERIELVPYCRYVEGRDSMRIVNSKGLDISKSNEYCAAVLGVVAGVSKDNPNKQNGFEVKETKIFKEINVDKIVDVACKRAIAMLGAAPIPSKEYPMIIENEAMADLLAGFFSMFTGEAAIRKLTALNGKLNEKIMDEKISILDDPLNKDAVDQEPFDAEGVACYKKAVVEKGVFKMFLQNLKTAKYFNTTPTGNATTSSIRGFNFHIETGDRTKEEMIASISEGFLVTDLSGLHAGLNPISGDFSAQTQGFLIEDGKITKPVTLVVVSGNFLKIMNDVVSVGSDLKLGNNGFGAPSILFKGLQVSGN